jgi:hypothetical protein
MSMMMTLLLAKFGSERPFERRDQPTRPRKALGAVHPMAERLNIRLIDRRFFNSPKQR